MANGIEISVKVRDEATKSLKNFTKSLDQTGVSAKTAADSIRKIIKPTDEMKKGLKEATDAQNKFGRKTGEASDSVEKQVSLLGQFSFSLEKSLPLAA